MLVVLRNHPPSVQTTLYYLRAVLNAAIGYQGMHLPYWRGEPEDVEGEVRRVIRGYEGIPTEVPWCVLRSPTAYYGEGHTHGKVHCSLSSHRLCTECGHNHARVANQKSRTYTWCTYSPVAHALEDPLSDTFP